VLSGLVRAADIVIASQDELGLVVTSPQDELASARELAESGVIQLVIKRGAGGATVWCEGHAHHAALSPSRV
jgi:sugar/nucleoside kinase (ribokinase family)